MRIRKNFTIIGIFVFLFICMVLYFMIDQTMAPKFVSIRREYQENEWLRFENRLKRLEDDLNKHGEDVGEIKKAIGKLIPISSDSVRLISSTQNHNLVKHSNSTSVADLSSNSQCILHLDHIPKMNVQMLDVYEELKFDNPDGGAWKQGFRIDYNREQWSKHRKLHIFVMPHSHNDPGWLKTIDQYYTQQTKKIFDNMIVKLPEEPQRKFVWAETSYLSMWWADADADNRHILKQLISSGKLEIVTGGWVMPDEANSHWLSIVTQMTEGHEWLSRNVNVTPQVAWSIDPFGQSPTMGLLLSKAGFKAAVINRVHYAVKKVLAAKMQLEFRWRQTWAGNSAEMLTHMMPFYSYDIPHTCGPDPKICCQFDFRRLPGHGVSCPWRVPPVPITDQNVESRANLLLDQYRKKSQLYQTNTLLVPLGDDFRYDHIIEWDSQYKNYQALFDYMNSDPAMNVEIKFGTLSDYFNELKKQKPFEDFPTLSGDFFTYADRDDHYWSGYYTSRPLYKRLDRILIARLRAAELLATLASASSSRAASMLLSSTGGISSLLTEARQSLSLFQHHDAITGTAKDDVVIDYGQRLLTALINSEHVMQLSADILLSINRNSAFDADAIRFELDDKRSSHAALSEQKTLTIGPNLPSKKVVLFNSLPFARKETVVLYVSEFNVEVTDTDGKAVVCQISPVFNTGATVSQTRFELTFIAQVPAFGLVTYSISANPSPTATKFAQIRVLNYDGNLSMDPVFTDVKSSPSGSDFSIHNKYIAASFSRIGLLKAIRTGNLTLPIHLDFAQYGVRQSAERSGAYLFLPDGEARPIKIDTGIVRIIQGPLHSSVSIQLPHVLHTVSLFDSPGPDGLGIQIRNIVNIISTNNFELVMRLSTDINSEDVFYTDLNGYQIIRRKRFRKLPIQANYYPMPSTVYIEDRDTRLTVLTAGPLGVSSLRRGQIEIMQDRRLMQDDNRGLGQGVMDNLPTEHIFRILLERRMKPKCRVVIEAHPAGFPTLAAHVASESLLHPLFVLLRKDGVEDALRPRYSSVLKEPGTDITVPVLRGTVYKGGNDDNVGLLLHRQHVDTCFMDLRQRKEFPLSDGKVNIYKLIPPRLGTRLTESTISFMHMSHTFDINSEVNLCPMDLKAFLVHS